MANPYAKYADNPYAKYATDEPETPQAPQEHWAYREVMGPGGWGTGFPKLAYDIGGKVTDVASNIGLPPEAAAGGGYLANLFTQFLPSLFASGRVADAPAQSLLGGPAKWLMQSAVKPKTADLASGAAKKAVKTMLAERIKPTVGGMEKASKITKNLDEQVEKLIAGSQAKVKVSDITKSVREPYKKAIRQFNPRADMKAVREVFEEAKAAPLLAGKKEIPVSLAHALKKGTYKSLGGKSYGEVGTASTEAQKALASGARQAVAQAVPEVANPLARQAALMNVRDVAGHRALLEANKNPMGLAALRMDNPLSAASFMADRWAWLKAALALQMQTGAAPHALAPLGIAAAQKPDPELLRQLGNLQR